MNYLRGCITPSVRLRGCITPSVRQTWVSLPLLLAKLNLGMSLGFTSSFLTAIQKPDSDIKMELSTYSTFASIIGVSAMVGFIIASCTLTYGRRLSMILFPIPGIVGQYLTYFAQDVTTLIIGRFLSGVTFGGTILMGTIMVGECTSPRNRGTFLNMSTAALNLGSLLIHLVGYHTSWRNLAVIISIPFILASFFAYISPESPSWLAERKQNEKSRMAFYTLRGKTPETTREIDELINAQNYKCINKTAKESMIDFFLKFKKKNFLKPLLVCAFALILTETSGRHIFPSYAGGLLQELKSNVFSTYYTNIVLDLLIILCSTCASYLVRIVDVRTLLFTSGTATVLALFSACTIMYLVKHEIIAEFYSWVSMVLFVSFSALANLGCTCIPFMIVGELFPLEHRVVASIIANTMGSGLMAIFLKIYPLIAAACSTHGAFALLGVCMIVVLLVLYFILPETRNRTLLEIEDYFKYGTFRDGVVVPTDDVES